jgi:hypothetical protein
LITHADRSLTVARATGATLAAALAMAGAAGCGARGTDAGGGGTTDAGGTDSGTFITEALQCDDGAGGLGPCDFSCLYTAFDPAPLAITAPDTLELTGIVNDFFDNVPVMGATVEVWLDNSVELGTPDGVSGITAADGAFTISLDPAAVPGLTGNVRVAYRTTINDPDYVDTYEFNEFASAADETMLERFTVPQLTVQIILGLFNLTLDPAGGQIAGAFEDCGRANVANGIVRVFSDPHVCGSAGGQLPIIIGYFDGNEYPDPNQTDLNSDGLWLGANVTAPRVVIEVWGSLTAGAPAQLVGCGPIDVEPGTIDIIDMAPYAMTL